MIHIPMADCLLLYEELIEANEGRNGFDGDTAELYMFRFGFQLAAWERLGDLLGVRSEKVRQANESLYNLIAFFVHHHPDARVEVEGREFGEWVREAGFEHRVHVRVERVRSRDDKPWGQWESQDPPCAGRKKRKK